MLRHVLGGIIGLVLTPCAITLLVYGGWRYYWDVPRDDFDPDGRGLATLAAGALVLLLVAVSGALSPAAPLVGALWGLGPAALYLLAPEGTVELIDDVPAVPDQARAGAALWLADGSYLAVGVILLGGFVATAMRRPR